MTTGNSSSDESDIVYCKAQKDGECGWEQCPQLRDNEPEKTGRSCPLEWFDYE